MLNNSNILASLSFTLPPYTPVCGLSIKGWGKLLLSVTVALRTPPPLIYCFGGRALSSPFSWAGGRLSFRVFQVTGIVRPSQ